MEIFHKAVWFESVGVSFLSQPCYAYANQLTQAEFVLAMSTITIIIPANHTFLNCDLNISTFNLILTM